MKKVLIVGSGQGSWSMRGQQIGLALGARVRTVITDADLAWADVVVLVKRAASVHAERVWRAGLPIVWDALDFWRQPQDNSRSEESARSLLRKWIAEVKPALVIGATEAMADAAGGICIPHHSWLGLRPTVPREVVQTVAYDGEPRYLHSWEPAIRKACERRGWRFVVKPDPLTDADMLVSLRGGPWDGWMSREWKSGVKVVNAICAGRPIITQDCAAVRELQPEGSVIERLDELDDAFDCWTPVQPRMRAVLAGDARVDAFSVGAMAARYRAVLAGVESSCTA